MGDQDMTEKDQLASAALAAIDAARETILAVGDDIHAHPELGLEEHHAAELLTSTIAGFGFEVERPAGGIETAFIARRRGRGDGPRIAFLAEYDALPGLGHGCGHNLIASSNLAAAIGAGAALDRLGGEILLVGTPAEENAGGKVIMAENGAFDGIDVAMSSHHGGHEVALPTTYPDGTCLAATGRHYIFHGRTAHAAGEPEQGINALNAVILFFNGIDAMRQHVTPDVRIHGIVTDGGQAVNVVPDHASAEFLFRASSQEGVEDLLRRGDAIARAAAEMTGARLEIDDSAAGYADMRPNYALSQIVRDKLETVGLAETERPPATGPGAYSTDLGNVSRRIPTTSLTFAISEVPINGHSKEVVEGSISGMGRENALRTGKALALAAVDLLADPDAYAAVRKEFEGARLAPA
jgi:amidohydrolase